MKLLTGQTLKIGHLAQPDTMAMGQMVMGFSLGEMAGVSAFDVTRIRGEQYEIAHSILIMVLRLA
jgi:hypothetical protein